MFFQVQPIPTASTVLPLCFVAVAFYTPFWHLWSGSALGSACAAFYVIEG